MEFEKSLERISDVTESEDSEGKGDEAIYEKGSKKEESKIANSK